MMMLSRNPLPPHHRPHNQPHEPSHLHRINRHQPSHHHIQQRAQHLQLSRKHPIPSHLPHHLWRQRGNLYRIHQRKVDSIHSCPRSQTTPLPSTTRHKRHMHRLGTQRLKRNFQCHALLTLPSNLPSLLKIKRRRRFPLSPP
ncbi:hypothetical protein BC829DRAFT_135068 [Chytridium lagenaria]|nr:hypothetical protein BC829DRAFT_135068 [Chytridium lagenaria]